MGVLDQVVASDAPRAVPGSEALRKGLEAIRTHMGMAVAYISEFENDNAVFRQVDAPNLEDQIKVGDSMPLDDIFCRHILDGRLPELMPDVTVEPLAMSLPIMQKTPIGAHMSVPIRMPDGDVYGMFCCLSFEANPSLNERDLKMMRVFADMAAHQIGRDRADARAANDKHSRIREVIETESFRIVYQPIWDFSSRDPIGFECLCRFPSEPYRTPDIWFKEAAEVGEAVPLELAVVRKALTGARAIPAGTYISINASPDLILSRKLPALLADFADIRIVVEVTEHSQIADYEILREALLELRSTGVQLAVDDAGAGYSSLQHIIQLRPDIIKLDIGLTRAVDTDTARRALISALIYFARETSCLIIAEGIETESERDILRLLGVSKGQGYLMGRPMDLDDATRLFNQPAAATAA